MRYAHRLEERPDGSTLCLCGVGHDYGTNECPAAMRERIAELERGQGSMHKAADAGRREGWREERERIAAWLEPTAKPAKMWGGALVEEMMRAALTSLAAALRREPCEGCRAPSTCRDAMDVPLCAACFDALSVAPHPGAAT